MTATSRILLLAGLFGLELPSPARAADPVAEALARPIIGSRQSLAEVQDFVEVRIPPMPEVADAADWSRKAETYRADVLRKVVLRGEAAAWDRVPTRVEWLGVIEGQGYRIKKLRFEVIPGLRVPGLLYEPANPPEGKIPGVLNLSGHDAKGMATEAKQIRCITLAKKGILALSLEWFGMGQLNGSGFGHGLSNALDLCGTSGVSLHHLAQRRGIDVLLAHERIDPARIGVTGLSGGGWQTIFASALDPRVTLADPVAGYSSFRTRVHYLSDLGDSEQTPCDLATVVDYAHLTAMLAPRPALLTFNGKDNCCFASGHALAPLVEAASPIYRLFGKPDSLRSHINADPGDHNYGLDNRRAFYRIIADHWSTPDRKYDDQEGPTEAEIQTPETLRVDLPADNDNWSTVAARLGGALPKYAEIPEDEPGKSAHRQRLRQILRPYDGVVTPIPVGETEAPGLHAASWKIKVGQSWTVPAVELWRGKPTRTAVLIADSGRKSLAGRASALMDRGYRVVAIDLFSFGEAEVAERGYLFGLMIGTVGERPIGVQVGQLLAVARWRADRDGAAPLVVAEGLRTSTIATAAASVDANAIAGLILKNSLASLKDLIARKQDVSQSPELFCFGLLESYDIPQMRRLVGPREVTAEP